MNNGSRFDEWITHLRETGNEDLAEFGFIIERPPSVYIGFKSCLECGKQFYPNGPKKYCDVVCCQRAAYVRRRKRIIHHE